jgi:hypothetical protein
MQAGWPTDAQNLWSREWNRALVAVQFAQPVVAAWDILERAKILSFVENSARRAACGRALPSTKPCFYQVIEI